MIKIDKLGDFELARSMKQNLAHQLSVLLDTLSKNHSAALTKPFLEKSGLSRDFAEGQSGWQRLLRGRLGPHSALPQGKHMSMFRAKQSNLRWLPLFQILDLQQILGLQASGMRWSTELSFEVS